MEAFLNFTGTAFQYLPGFNANGIVPSEDGRYLIVAQTNAGKLFRVTIATREVVEIDLGGEPVPADGLQLAGRTLWAVSQGGIARLTLSDDLTSGRVYSRTVDKNFRAPTTNALADGQMLVVNSQFPARASGPVLPFTVSSIGIP